MKKEYKKLPYRNNVSLIIFKNKQFLMVNLVDWEENWWKFPQGGIHDGETLYTTGMRECKEELGTDKIKILGQSKFQNKYDWPDEVIEKKQQHFRGQSQKFLVMVFLGKNRNIRIGLDEVRKYRWATREEVIRFSKDSQHMLFQNYNGIIPKILKEFLL